MSIIYWSVIVLFLLVLLVGFKDWLYFFMWSWNENGKLFTLFLIVLVALFISPSLIKSYAPEYYGASIWALIGYIVFLIAYRFMRVKKYKNTNVEG